MMDEPRREIRATLADLAVFQSCVALGFAQALDRRGLISRFEFAEVLETVTPEATGTRTLMGVFLGALRLPANDD